MLSIITIFIVALVSNFLWENIHSHLYDNYKGGRITQFILFRASLFDALLISIIVPPFIFLESIVEYSWAIIIVGFIVAIFNEWYGLNTKRWKYKTSMPIIPVLNVGITPAVQLAVLGYASFCLYKNIADALFTFLVS